MPEDYRHVGPTEPLYHQPPTALETQERYQGGCVAGEAPGMVAAGGNSLASPYFAQHQLRLSQSSGRRFSPLRLHLDASKSSWRRCSWRCTTVVFVCVTLCLAATTTFFATSQVSRWHSAEGCLDDAADTASVNVPQENTVPPQGQPAPPPGNQAAQDGWRPPAPDPPAMYPPPRRGQHWPRGGPRPVFPAPSPPHAAPPSPQHDSFLPSVSVKIHLFFHKIKDNLHAFLWPVIDVSQEPSAEPPRPSAAHTAAPAAGFHQKTQEFHVNAIHNVDPLATKRRPPLARRRGATSLAGHEYRLVDNSPKRPAVQPTPARHARSAPGPPPQSSPALSLPSPSPSYMSSSGHATPASVASSTAPPRPGPEVLSRASSAAAVNNPEPSSEVEFGHATQATNVAQSLASLVVSTPTTTTTTSNTTAVILTTPTPTATIVTTSTSVITTPVTTVLGFSALGNLSAEAPAGVPTPNTPSLREDSGAAEVKPKSVAVSGAPGAEAPPGVTRAPGDLTLSSHVYQVTSGTLAAPGAILSPTEEGEVPPQLAASLTPSLPVPLGGPTRTPPAGGQGAPVLQNVFRDSTNDGKVNLLPSGEVEGEASLGHQGSSRPPEAPTPNAAAATLSAPPSAAPDKEFTFHPTPSSFSSTSTPTSSYIAGRTTATAAATTTTPSPLTAAPTPVTSISISSSSSSSSSLSSSSPPRASEAGTAQAPPSSLTTAAPGTPSTSPTPSLSSSSPLHSSTTPPLPLTPPLTVAPAATTTIPTTAAAAAAARDNATAFAQPFPDEALKPGHFGANNTSIRGSHGGSGANHNQDAVMPNPRAGRVISHKAEPLQKENPAPKRGNQEPSRFKEEEIKEGEGGGGEGVEGSNERQREGDEARHSSQPQHPQDTPRTQAGHVAQPAALTPPPPPRGRLSHYPQNTHDDFNSSRPSDGSLSRHDPSEQRDGPSVVSQDSGRGRQGNADQVFSSLAGQGGEKSEDAVSAPARENQEPSAQEIARSHVAYEAERQIESEAVSKDSFPSTSSEGQPEEEEEEEEEEREEEGLEKHYAGVSHAAADMSEQGDISLPKIELSEPDHRGPGGNTRLWKNGFTDGRANGRAGEEAAAAVAELAATEGRGAGHPQTAAYNKPVIDPGPPSVSSRDPDDLLTLASPPPAATPRHAPANNTKSLSVGGDPVPLLPRGKGSHRATHQTPDGLPAREDQISMISTSQEEYNGGDEEGEGEGPDNRVSNLPGTPDAARPEDQAGRGHAGSVALTGHTNTSRSVSSEAPPQAFNPPPLPGGGSSPRHGAATATSESSKVKLDGHLPPVDAPSGEGDHSPQLPGNASKSEGPPVMLAETAAKNPMRLAGPVTLPGAAPFGGGGEGEPRNNPIEVSEEVTPRSGIDTSLAGQVSNGHSYPGVGGSLALPIVGAASPPDVLDDQAASETSSNDGIGINDVAAKDQRDKAAHEISLSRSNQTGEIAGEAPPHPSTHDLLAALRPPKRIESEKKQSGPKSMEASARAGYSERTESSIDTEGSEASQGRPFLSRSNQMVDDPNQESVHARVSSRDSARENRDQDAYLSGCGGHDGAAAGGGACPEDEEHRRRQGSSEGNNSWREAIEGDERDPARLHGDSLDGAMEGSLPTEHLNDEAPARRRDTPAAAPTPGPPAGVEGKEAVGSDHEGEDVPVGQPHHASHSGPPSLGRGSGSNNSPLDSSGNSSQGGSSGETRDSGHSIMPYRDPRQSRDSPCKCSCQCDGGEAPPIMPGRVAANLNSEAVAGGPITSLAPSPSPTPPPPHHHRHHHHGHRGGGPHATPPTVLSSHPTDTTTSPPSSLSSTPTPPLASPVTLRDMAPQVPNSGEDRPTSAASATRGGGTVVRQLSYTAVSNPAVTLVVPQPSLAPDPAATRAPGTAAAIHASLVLGDDQGSQTQARPQQVAPPDGSSFSPLSLGEELAFNLAPYGYWNLHLTLNDPTDIRITLTKPRGTSLGLYARRSSLPTHTQHDVMKILREARQRDVRASPNMVEVSVEQVLEAGEWFISIYNDDGDPHQVALVINRGDGGGECPQRCHDRGHCILGRCHCHAGYSGIDCSQMLCPILCAGHGDYVSGQCKCHAGFKGKECQLRHHECEVPDCNGKGQCVAGRCRCAKGFTGEFCEKVDCPHPTCSGNGWCVNGTCVCQKGWRGPDCSETDLDARQCLPDCNEHGRFDIELQRCVCNHPWTGSDCSKKSCSLDCGLHGVCENDACRCEEGWKGDNCSEKLCDARCNEHGQCKNGTCVCMTGWNGRHCTLSGCPGNCRNRGTCNARGEDGIWSCSCENGWDGPDCSAMLETRCNDGEDNDKDGLVDCQDPECCDHHSCNGSQLCVSRASSPIELLLRKQPPAATASFFEKMKFLIEDDSLQHFPQPDAFNKRRAAVVRGRVVTRAGRGVIGLRVTSGVNGEGFTLTRNDGMFDIMVNGGGTVTLLLGRPPFGQKTVRVMVPWNKVVVLDDIVMTVSGSTDHSASYHDHLQRRPSHCPQHDYDLLRPIIMATWQNVFQGECPHADAILVESQAVQESIQIPGTDVYLVYHSSRANGYESTIRMQLTPDYIPATLRRVHLRIVLEGTLFTRVFEADPNIKFTYAWDRYNVYRQRVHGVTVALVSVGYEHASCPKIIWEHQTTRVAGNDLLISMIGGFNLHIHHTYNYHQGILQKGDGQNIYLAGQRRLVTTLLGTGEQREVLCGDRCEGHANEVPLLTPSCLAAAPDGSLYVGDFTLIHRVWPDGTVTTVARLNETRVSYRYHMAVSPVDGTVYVSDPEAHQVLHLGTTRENVPVVVVGSGQRCLPGDKNRCGDGGQAIHARLTYPKGLAISLDGDIYIADGTNIRVVSRGVIQTIIGGHDHRSHWAPVPCNGTINMDQLHLRWPTELAISPLDGSLHILDDHLVLRVTPDNRVQVLSGRSLNCPTPPHDPPDVSRTALLLSPQSIAFSPEGELYVAESDSQRINRVRIITSDGRISLFAGAESECNCRDPTCHCHTYDNVSATSAIFFSISSIAVTPDGVLHIADQAGYRVRSVRTVLPELIDRKHYEIISPDSHEVYVFNSRGQHTETRNLVTGQTIYKFLYNSHSSVSRLWTVSDGAGNKFHITRERGGNVNAIETPQKQLIKIHLTMTDKLEKLVAPNGYNISFTYNSLRSSGLISSKIEALGRSFNYDYDEQGRLTRAVLPTGQVIQLNFDLSARGAEVTVTRDGKNPVKTRVRGNTLTHTSGPMEAVADMGGEGKLRVLTDWDHKVSLERTSYRVLESTSQIAAEMFPILSRQQTHIGGSLVNRYEWIYSPASQHATAHGMKVSATLRVNNADLLMLRYDPTTSSEALLSVSGQMLVNITYDNDGRPVLWMPVSPLVPSNVSYDEWGHIIGWTRGNLSEEYEYDRVMRLMSVTYADGARITYDYKDDRIKPQKVQHPSGRTYGLVYDDAGSLRQVVTPRRTAYTLHVSTSLGFYRLRLALPVDNIALQVRLDEQGRILAMTQPGQGGTLLYKYDDFGRLSGELYGRGFTDYTYDDMGLIHTAKTKHNHIDVRTDYRYHAGLIKDMRLRYGSKSDLHNVRLKFIYDASARLRRVEGEINSNPLKEVIIRFDNQTGILNLISDLRIIRNNILETMLQNPKKDFVNTRIQDHYGRLAEVDMTLQGRTVYMMKLKYDNRNRISERLIEVAGRREGLNITYTPDGEILKVTGTLRWVYSYDENGNIVRNGYTEALTYDECDRVIKVGGRHVVYDDRGFVISFDNQNFEYNTKGLLVSAWDREQKWSFTLGYDHLDRVSVYRDHQNNATQIIYGRPDLPELITHLHNPHTGATTHLLYDDMNHLIAMDQPDGRYYVATDQNGTPIAIFDNMGSQINSLVWTPFGFLVDYSGTSMAVGVGPWGRFREPQTGLVLFRGHAYHPEILQWMTPRWGHLTNPKRLVTDVFVYRFMNNNPFVSPPGSDSHYYTDVSEWLDLYGIQVDRVLGSEYHKSTLVKPRPVVAVDDLGTSEVMSGLWCQYRACVKHLHDLSFFSDSNIQSRMGTWTGVPISRQVSIFGPGVLVSNIDGRVLVTKIGEGDFTGVVGDVIRSVLNNSIILDVSATHNGRDTFYFIKSNRNKAGEDINTLRRLSGVFNVTNSETEHGHEIRMSTPTAHLVIMYGERVQRARSRVLAELEQEAEQRAWDREAALVRMGRVGSHSWTAAEAAELEREGRVTGYVATHLHSPSRYPLLASDATNIVFKHESSRKRRKSRRKGRKKSWRQRKKVGV